MKLGIIVSHPIQYYTPVFQRMAKDISLKVFYTSKREGNFDKGFNTTVVWDLPLLIGYEYEFVSYKNIIDSITNYGPSALLLYGWAHAAHLMVLYHFKGLVQLTFRGDSTLFNKESGFKNFLKTFALKYIYSHIDLAFYVGSQNKLYYLKYGLKEHQLTFAPHGVDNHRFQPGGISIECAGRRIHELVSIKTATGNNLENTTATGNAISSLETSFTDQTNSFRQGLGIPADDLVILYAGKLDKNKNPTLLLKAFVELHLKDVHLVIAGSGILQEHFEYNSQQHRLVHYLPFQNQSKMPALYQMCDLFCLPTQSDSWGLSINEAMAAGKAILISDKAGAAVDLVQPANGKIFRSNNLTDLKVKLKELLSNPTFLKEAGQCSQEIIKNWTIEIQVKNILRCLNK